MYICVVTPQNHFVADNYFGKCHFPQAGLKSLLFKVLLILKQYENQELEQYIKRIFQTLFWKNCMLQNVSFRGVATYMLSMLAFKVYK